MKFNHETIAAIGTATGTVKLASGTITDPVVYLDIALPVGYDRFILRLDGLTGAGDFGGLGGYESSICVAFSYDGGETFLNDLENFDSYFGVDVGSLDALLVLSDRQLEQLLVADIMIAPATPAACILTGVQLVTGNANVASVNAGYVNVSATISPPTTKPNLMRLLYYNADGAVTPIAAPFTFTGGSYSLSGMPTL